MGAVDVHTHLDMPAWPEGVDAVVARARAAGVSGCVLAAADPAHWDRVRDTAEHLGMPYTLGLHPWWALKMDAGAQAAALARLEAMTHPHGVGETGLDDAVARTPAQRAQLDALTRWHLRLASGRGVPVVLHCVRAHARLLALVDAEARTPVSGLVHAWTGSAELAVQTVRRGLHVSIGPAVLRSDKVRRAAAVVPVDHLLLETDCPDGTAEPGRVGEPADLVAVAEAVAAARGVGIDEVLAVTAANARRLFPVMLCSTARGAQPE